MEVINEQPLHELVEEHRNISLAYRREISRIPLTEEILEKCETLLDQNIAVAESIIDTCRNEFPKSQLTLIWVTQHQSDCATKRLVMAMKYNLQPGVDKVRGILNQERALGEVDGIFALHMALLKNAELGGDEKNFSPQISSNN